jgi:hypothetical protein
MQGFGKPHSGRHCPRACGTAPFSVADGPKSQTATTRETWRDWNPLHGQQDFALADRQAATYFLDSIALCDGGDGAWRGARDDDGARVQRSSAKAVPIRVRPAEPARMERVAALPVAVVPVPAPAPSMVEEEARPAALKMRTCVS